MKWERGSVLGLVVGLGLSFALAAAAGEGTGGVADQGGMKKVPVPGRVTDAPARPALPDVTAKIRQDIMDFGTRYRAKITVENQGTAPMPEVTVHTLIIPNYHIGNPPTPEQCITDPSQPCERHKRTVSPLAPGQKKSYHAGKKRLLTTTILVQVGIGCTVPGQPVPTPCPESNSENNTVKRVLGPH